MTAARPPVLYTPDLLALATDLARFPLASDLPLHAEARSRTCGSVIAVGLELGEDAAIRRIGMQVTACAIGQASAALLARSVAGRDAGAVEAAAEGIAAWLAGDGALPDWPDLALLAPAQAHKGRHGALLLPWTAAAEALSTRAGQG